jgi:ATP-binding cassette subfamily B protein
MRWFGDLIDAFAPANGPPPQTSWAFVRWGLAGSWAVLGAALATGALSGLAETASAFLLGWVIDDALALGASGYWSARWPVLAAVAAFYLVLRPLLMGLNGAMNGLTVGPNLTPLVLSRIHRHTMGQALSFFDDDFAGRISQKQMQVARAVTEVASEMVNVVTFTLATLAGAFALVGAIDWRLTAGLALWLGGYGLFVRYYIPRVRAASRARATTRAAVTGQVVDTLTNIATVKLFARSGREDQAALGAMRAFRSAALDFGMVSTWFRFNLMILAGVLPVMMIGGSLYIWSRGEASAGDIAMAGLISTRLSQMTGWVSFTAIGIFSNIGEIEDGVKTLTVPHRITDRPDAVAGLPLKGDIRFNNVTFSYGETGRGALDGFSLHVRPGERVGLVGRSGAGKSTVVSLLLRLYEAEEGAITIDGRPQSSLTQDSLRSQIAVVRQESAMFNRSARDNILYGRPDASESEMVAAARGAEAHDFILGLRDWKGRTGYDAHLGERGVKLSGGQRQRIALARAILKDAPVMVLDEATSALDSEAEASIQEVLSRVMQGRTVIAIAHRLSTIAAMDRIVVMDEGRVAETGTHALLLARGGLYASFWARQSGGYLGVDAAE